MFYLWIACSLISTIYTYTWDVKMDWGLFSKNSGEYTFLREEIVYDNTVSFSLLYYFIIFSILLSSLIVFTGMSTMSYRKLNILS